MPVKRILLIITQVVFGSWGIEADSTTVLDKLIVKGTKKSTPERIIVNQEEKKSGLTDDVNKLLILKPGITAVPEAGSSLLVRGESPFDNSFRLYNVPMFAPSHFSNSLFCDHSATMIETVNDVRVTTDRMAGRYAGASASVIACDPGIVRPADPKLIPRPELSAGMGTLAQDFSLSFPFRNGADISQLSFTNTDAYKIKWLGIKSKSTDQAAFGYGMPSSFGDLVYTGTNSWKGIALREYGLYAYDIYSASYHGSGMTVPWGAGALSVEDTMNNGIVKVTAGGSRQHFYDGKKYVDIIPLAHVERTNGTVRADLAEVKKGYSAYDASLQLERLEWSGSQEILPNTAPDMTPKDHAALEKSVQNKETEVTIHAGAQRGFGRASIGANILAGCVAPWYKMYADPGIWAKVQHEKWSTGISAGITTTRPDIRGLPSYDYRGTLQKTYSVSVNGQTVPAKWLDLGADAYVKWKDRSPARSLVPGNLVWDPSLESPLLVGGVSTSVVLAPIEHWTLTMMQDFAWANRQYSGVQQLYEWNVPWSQKSILRYSIMSDRLHFFLIGFFSEGLPYREIVHTDTVARYATEISRTPMYKRVDFKIQFNQPVEKHRFLTRYDCYVEVNNIFDWPNVREYYFDYDMARLPMFLERFGVNLGVRLGFRL
jgi:hypothetical protein